MKSFLFVLMVPAFGFAQTSVANSHEINNRWSVEGIYSTISNSNSSTFGPSLLYAMTDTDQIGFRTLAPTSNNSNGTTSFAALYRHFFSLAKTGLFEEATIAENFYSSVYKSISAPSLGTNIGIVHHFSEDISFGGIAGFEWTQTHFNDYFAYNNASDLVVYARFAIFGTLSF